MQLYRFDPDLLAAAYGDVGSQVVEIVGAIRPGGWGEALSGAWDVKTLVAHTMRAFSGVTNYLVEGEGQGIELVGPISYYTAAFASGVSTVDIDRRAVAAGKALEGDVAEQCRSSYELAVASVKEHSPDAPVKTPFGVMALADYLPSRIVELVAHGEDLKAATGSGVELAADAVEVAAVTCSSVAAQRGLGVDALLVLTGRRATDRLNVLGFDAAGCK